MVNKKLVGVLAGLTFMALGSSIAQAGQDYVMRVKDGAVGKMVTSLTGDKPYFQYGTEFSQFMHNLAFPDMNSPNLRRHLKPFKKGFSVAGNFDAYDTTKGKAADANKNGYLSTSEIANAAGMNEWQISHGMGAIEKMIENAMKDGGAEKDGGGGKKGPGGGSV